MEKDIFIASREFKGYENEETTVIKISSDEFVNNFLYKTYLGLLMIDYENEPQEISLDDLINWQGKNLGISLIESMNDSDYNINFYFPVRLKKEIRQLLLGKDNYLKPILLNEDNELVNLFCFIAFYLTYRSMNREVAHSLDFADISYLKTRLEYYSNLKYSYRDEYTKALEKTTISFQCTTNGLDKQKVVFEERFGSFYPLESSSNNSLTMSLFKAIEEIYDENEDHILIGHTLFEVLNVRKSRTSLYSLRVQYFTYIFYKYLLEKSETNKAKEYLCSFIFYFYRLLGVSNTFGKSIEKERPWQIFVNALTSMPKFEKDVEERFDRLFPLLNLNPVFNGKS